MLGKIDEVRATESPVIATARDEISRLRKSAEDQVKNSQDLIERLRNKLGIDENKEAIDTEIADLNTKIKNANKEIDTLTEQKYELEAEYRKLEAEVGPIKYIAEFIYGSADKNLLEEAVRWVIVILVLVFDPLAVVMVLAGITLIKWRKENDWSEGDEMASDIAELQFMAQSDTEEWVTHSSSAKSDTEESIDESEFEDDQKPNPFKKDLLEEQKEEVTEPAEEEAVVIEESTEPAEEKAVVIKEPEVKEAPDKRGSFAKDATEWEGLYEDNDGYYTVDNSGRRNYAIDPDQEKVNRKAEVANATKQQIDKVVARMKDEGMWPNPPTPTERPSLDQILESDKSGELEKILNKADDDTLAQVYQAILADMKPQPNRKSD